MCPFSYTTSISLVMLHLHWIFGAATLVGFILLTVWALKHLEPEKLRSFTALLLIVGITGTLLTAPLAVTGFRWMMGVVRSDSMGQMWNAGMMEQMMNMMMGHDEGTEGEEHDEHEEMEEMMRQMMQGTWHDQQGNTRGMMMENMGNRMMNP